MNRRWIVALMAVAMLAVPGYTRAHEGHAHKVMGTVSTRAERELAVKGTDGKTATITVNEKTRILRGKKAVELSDVKPGERVVVTAMETKDSDGRKTMVASEVRLAAAAAR